MPKADQQLLDCRASDMKNYGAAARFFLQSSPWLEEHQGHGGGQGFRGVKVCRGGEERSPQSPGKSFSPSLLSSTCLSVQLRNLFFRLNLPLLLLMFKTITDTMKTPAAALISATVWGLRRPDCTRQPQGPGLPLLCPRTVCTLVQPRDSWCPGKPIGDQYGGKSSGGRG